MSEYSGHIPSSIQHFVNVFQTRFHLRDFKNCEGRRVSDSGHFTLFFQFSAQVRLPASLFIVSVSTAFLEQPNTHKISCLRSYL